MSESRVLVVHNSASDPIGRVGEWLTAAGVDQHIVDGVDLPDDLVGFDGLVVLGGPMGANDDVDAPWLPKVRTLLRAAVADEVPTLGICLGAQLLAVANGGRVAVNPQGPEIGAQLVAKRSAAAAQDPLFAALPITPDVIQWHYDAIMALPPGAVLLAGSPACENQAFRLGRLAWGIQFHIETVPEVVRAWAAQDADRLEGYNLDLIVNRADAVHDDLAEAWQPFVAGFADIVRDPAAAPAAPAAGAERFTDPVDVRASLAAEAAASRAPLPMPGLRRADG